MNRKEGATLAQLYDQAAKTDPAGARAIWDDFSGDRLSAVDTATRLALLAAPAVMETWACPFCGHENPVNIADCSGCDRTAVRP